MAKARAISATAPVRTGAEAIALFASLLPFAATQERLIVAFLDDERHVLGLFEQAGDPESVALPLRRIVGDAIAYGATGLLLAHNHPSGDPTPSKMDVEVTRQLAAAGLPLGLTLHDHLIRAGDDWRSLVAMDLL